MNFTALYCTALHCTALHCTVLHCTANQWKAMHCSALPCSELHIFTMHCTEVDRDISGCVWAGDMTGIQPNSRVGTRYSLRIAPINDALLCLAGCKASELQKVRNLRTRFLTFLAHYTAPCTVLATRRCTLLPVVYCPLYCPTVLPYCTVHPTALPHSNVLPKYCTAHWTVLPYCLVLLHCLL